MALRRTLISIGNVTHVDPGVFARNGNYGWRSPCRLTLPESKTREPLEHGIGSGQGKERGIMERASPRSQFRGDGSRPLRSPTPDKLLTPVYSWNHRFGRGTKLDPTIVEPAECEFSAAICIGALG